MGSSVAVIDYGMGNLRSVCKALEHVGQEAGESVQVWLTEDPDRIRQADRVVFPGQGAIAGCVQALSKSGMDRVLAEVMANKPFLGICLGLQALYDFSEEGGGVNGLGVLPGTVRRFPRDMPDPVTGGHLKIPHMGWNRVHQTHAHPLWTGIAQDERFYFVHSYYADTADADADCVAATTDYGLTFTSAAGRANIFAVQFHPEKSQHAGLQLLKNFLVWDGTA